MKHNLSSHNRDMRDHLTRLLAVRFDVESVGDGKTALEAVRRCPPVVIVIDVMMPGLDGFQLLAALRADETTRTLPFILLSARSGEEARIDGLDAGADDYLVKPFSARELVARVDAQFVRVKMRRGSEGVLLPASGRCPQQHRGRPTPFASASERASRA